MWDDRLCDVALSADGSRLAVATSRRSVFLIDGRSGATVAKTAGQRVAFARDADVLATGGGRRGELWHVDGARRQTFKPHRHTVNCVAITPRGDVVATGSGGWYTPADWRVRLWSSDTGALRCKLEHGAPVTDVALSPDGALVASVSERDQTLRVWSVDDGSPRGEIALPERACSVRWSPDGAWLAVGGAFVARVFVCELAAARVAYELDATMFRDAHVLVREAMVFDGAGRLLLGYNAPLVGSRRWNGCLGGFITWDVAERVELGRRVLHASPLAALAVSADGRRLASAGHDRAVRVWDLASGARLLGPSRPSKAWVQGVVTQVDGPPRLVALGPDVLPPLAEIPEAREHYEDIAADIALYRSLPDFDRVWG